MFFCAPGDMWSEAATSVMEELVSGVILFAVVVSYTEDCVPLINLYRRDQDQVSTGKLREVREAASHQDCDGNSADGDVRSF